MARFGAVSDGTVDERRLRKALARDPDRLDALHALGTLLQRQGRCGEAVEHFRQALERQPAETSLYIGLACAFHAGGHGEAAAEVCGIALQLHPDCAEAHNNRGAILRGLGRLEEAESDLRRAIVLRPDYPEAYVNLGNVLKLSGDPAAAIECYRRALGLQPDNASAYTNIGNALVAQGRLEEAGEAYAGALRFSPDLPEAHWNQALLWLRQGDFKRGWPEYEWGFAAGERSERSFSRSRWRGQPLDGHRLLVWAEQGFGDTLQFARYLPVLRDFGAEVVLECPRELVALLRDSGLADAVVEQGAAEDLVFDFQVPLLSLPGLLGARVESIPGTSGYLRADPQRVMAWRSRMDLKRPGLHVGLVWSCNPRLAVDGMRVCPLEPLLDSLGEAGKLTLYSLQKERGGDGRGNGCLVDFTQEFNDFADTAALVANLDLVITVDTVVAHLAGALERPVWTLLSMPADWRWMEHSTNTPWYRSMKLLRQSRAGDWNTVFKRLPQLLRTIHEA